MEESTARHVKSAQEDEQLYVSALLSVIVMMNYHLLNTLLNAETTQTCHRHLATTEISRKA